MGRLTFHHFGISTADTGLLRGHALLCVDARYASLRVKGAARLHRGFASPAEWQAIVGDLRIGWPKGFVDMASATARVLLPPELRTGVALQQIAQPAIDLHTDAPTRLDAYLWALEV